MINSKIVWKHGPSCWYYHLNFKFLGWPYKEYIKIAKTVACSDDFLSGDEFDAVFPFSVLMSMVRTLLRQLRRSLELKKIITNDSFLLYSLHSAACQRNNSRKSCLLGNIQRIIKSSRRHYKTDTLGPWWVVSMVEVRQEFTLIPMTAS